jgi:hypothetical protein
MRCYKAQLGNTSIHENMVSKFAILSQDTLNDSLDLVKGVTTNFGTSEPRITWVYLIGCAYTATNCSTPGLVVSENMIAFNLDGVISIKTTRFIDILPAESGSPLRPDSQHWTMYRHACLQPRSSCEASEKSRCRLLLRRNQRWEWAARWYRWG